METNIQIIGRIFSPAYSMGVAINQSDFQGTGIISGESFIRYFSSINIIYNLTALKKKMGEQYKVFGLWLFNILGSSAALFSLISPLEGFKGAVVLGFTILFLSIKFCSLFMDLIKKMIDTYDYHQDKKLERKKKAAQAAAEALHPVLPPAP